MTGGPDRARRYIHDRRRDTVFHFSACFRQVDNWRRGIRVRESLDALSLDALVVTSAVNIRYLSNHAGSAGILVLTRDGVHLLVDFRYRDAVRMLQESPAACPGLRAWDARQL